MKKEIPLQLLQIIEGFLKKYSDCVTVVFEENTFYRINDNDANSKFFLRILKEKPKNVTTNSQIHIERCPRDNTNVNVGYFPANYNNLVKLLEQWGDLIRIYNRTESVYDDPILKAYQKEFFDEYKIVDEDADYAPFSSKQLLFLDQYLENLSSGIQKYLDKKNEKFVKEVIRETLDVKENLKKLPKNEVMKKITSIWAKLQKEGLIFVKEFVLETKKEFMKIIIKNLLDVASNQIIS